MKLRSVLISKGKRTRGKKHVACYSGLGWKSLPVLLTACILFSPGLNLADQVAPTVTLLASTGDGFFIFEQNFGAGWGGATIDPLGNTDPLFPNRTVRKVQIPGSGFGIFIDLACLDATPVQDPEELVFEVRKASSFGSYRIKMESNGGDCGGVACNAEITPPAAQSSYQEVRIPLSNFTNPCNINESRLRNFVIISNQPTSLTLFFDNLRFE